jgi:hypothetical protein
VRQGCPLSPILGCIVINMLIRWVEDAGGGMSHASGVIKKIMVYINHSKSEIVGYDFKSQKSISTSSLKLATNNL